MSVSAVAGWCGDAATGRGEEARVGCYAFRRGAWWWWW